MSLNQIANTIDQQRVEADQRFKEHAADVETNLTGQAVARTTGRVTRRRASASASPPREDSPANSDVNKTRRTAAWASSLDSEQLQNIDEEESEIVDDEDTRHGTDPSSFPSGIFDNSYNYERGLRRPRILENSTNAVGAFLSDLGGAAYETASDVSRRLRMTASILSEASYSVGKATIRVLPYIAYTLFGLLAAAMGMMALSFFFCALYRRTLCDPASSSSLQTTLQNYCGSCLTTPYTFPENMTPEQQADISFISKAISDLRRQLHSLEKRIDGKLTAPSTLTSQITALQSRQVELESQLASFSRQSPTSSMQSLSTKINYFAPGSGAIINPLASSPTLQKAPPLFLKAFTLLTGSVKYISNPPAAALLPWSDLGDCWCAAGSDDVRLAVKLGYEVYPTEITVEHFPVDESPEPGTAPREIEVWAGFGHVGAELWAERGIWELVGTEPIGMNMGRIGRVVFEARSGVQSVQTFQLDVNQGKLMHSTDEVVLRVRGNHGAEKTCLYRVRLHGVPVVPHPVPLGVDA